MTVLILLILLFELVIFTGIVKIIEIVTCEKKVIPNSKGADFWLNIISYDHKKKGGDKN